MTRLPGARGRAGKMTSSKCLIAEGTSGTGKSPLICALLRRHVELARPPRPRTLVHLAQSHTYGPLASREDSGTLTVEGNQSGIWTGSLE